WAFSAKPDAELVIKALDMAYEQRGKPQQVLFHSDQGSQYASRKRLANTPPRFFQLAAWCPPVFGGHHFKPLAEDLPCQANAAP
ncbi:DDE-type integrase/transposase/recombinase, partial [Pseudomonas aeruginosa]|uniref:DDE-type integrase/transposase/recombinase n=1 Tax=Pseudomonas aeruginosa TaxID=287 RepID=UPI002FEE1D5C